MIDAVPHLRVLDYGGDVMLLTLDCMDALLTAKLKQDAFVRVETLSGVVAWIDPNTVSRCYIIDESKVDLIDRFNAKLDDAEALRKIGMALDRDDELDESDAFARFLNGR